MKTIFRVLPLFLALAVGGAETVPKKIGDDGKGIWHFEPNERLSTPERPYHVFVLDDERALLRMLEKRYDEMRRALKKNDYQAAASYFTPDTRQKMLQRFADARREGNVMEAYTADLDNSRPPVIYRGTKSGRVEFRTVPYRGSAHGGVIQFNLNERENIWQIVGW